MNESNYLHKIKFLIKNKNSKLRNLFNLLKYSRFFFNYKEALIESEKISSNFYNNWKERIKKDIHQKKNWRQKTNLDDGLDDQRKKYYDFASIFSILNFLSKSKKSIIDIGSYDDFFLNILKNDFDEIYFDSNLTKFGKFVIAIKK